MSSHKPPLALVSLLPLAYCAKLYFLTTRSARSMSRPSATQSPPLLVPQKAPANVQTWGPTDLGPRELLGFAHPNFINPVRMGFEQLKSHQTNDLLWLLIQFLSHTPHLKSIESTLHIASHALVIHHQRTSVHTLPAQHVGSHDRR